MFRQIALRQATRNTVARTTVLHPVRSLSYTLATRKSIVDTAKDVLENVNKKTGEILAGTMEATENAIPTKENMKEALKTVNKKTGEILADKMESAEETAGQVKSKASKMAGMAKEKTSEAKEKASEAKEKAGNLASEAKGKAENVAADVKEKAEDVDGAAAKARVETNFAGYKDLQDKGAKVESEQNRPDDAV